MGGMVPGAVKKGENRSPVYNNNKKWRTADKNISLTNRDHRKK